MTQIKRGTDGNLHMNRKGLWKVTNRPRWEPMRAKEKKCLHCGSMPWRVEGHKCKSCGLEYAEDVVEVEIPTLKSSQGTFEDVF